MTKLYAVVWQGKRTRPPVCFPKFEWAKSYRDYLHKRIPLRQRFLMGLTNRPGYIIMELDYCENPPTMAMTGNKTQQ